MDSPTFDVEGGPRDSASRALPAVAPGVCSAIPPGGRDRGPGVSWAQRRMGMNFFPPAHCPSRSASA